MTSPVAATVGATGISAPTYAQILAYFVSQFQAIYGADSYLGNDSQDGQWIGIIAQAVSDCNAAVIAAYNSFSPTTAVGTGLASNVKLNGLKVLLGSYSTATVTVVGQASTIITGGQAQDASGNLWALPSTVTIPGSGTIDVAVTCTTLGAITAAAHAINQIATPTLGWQSVDNAAQATPGTGVETNAALRVRQSQSVALPSVGIFDGIVASIRQITGVTRVTAYENNSNSTDGNGIPAGSSCFVVECPVGTQMTVAQAIALKLPPGGKTYGNVSTTVTSAAGAVRVINQQSTTSATFTAVVNVHTLNGWASSTASLIVAAVSAYFSSVAIGGVVNVASVIAAAQLISTSQASTFIVKSVTVAKNGGAPQSTDFTLGFSEACNPGVSTVNQI